ncbi:hypothetical protein RvY_12046 [Ramazzottius varieornatus]|uniref:Aminopeptidase n=1 Tax=Ramazzottius varieornatus TaxID=947166 RepID=A0A1D1VI70_RAMVA|nr:hypothetical protein RvY_12046 [Ramazzottius varieornatus]
MEPKTGMIVKIVVAVLFVTLLSMVIAFGVLWGQTKSEVAEKEKEIAELWKHTTVPSTGPGGNNVTTKPITPDTPFLRLPTHILPINYGLDLRVYLPFDQTEESMGKAFTTVGTVRIRLVPMTSDARNITLHARTRASASSGKITFTRDNVKLMRGADSVAISNVDFQHWTVDVFVVETQEPLVQGQEYILVVENFEGTIANDNQGLYRSSFERSGVKKYLATTQFQAFKARRVFPCFDEPGFRSTFEVTLRHDARFNNTRSNGERNASSSETFDGKQWTVQPFRTSPNMSAYLVAFLISDFGSRDDEIAAKPNRIFAIEDMLTKHDNARFPLTQSRQSLEYLDASFGQPYYADHTKMDQAGVPDFNAGAMENWGMVLYRETSLLYEPRVSSAEVKRGSAAIIGHELAHMIFGDLVTCKWWDDTWLNEGFARFFQYEIMNGAEGSRVWGLGPLFPYWVVREAMQVDAYSVSHALYDPTVNTLPDIDKMFDTVTYAKGASILHMIKGIMGREAFYSALKKYVAEYRMKNVVHQDLFKHLSAETVPEGGTVPDFTAALNSWVEQSGYPVIKLTRLNATGPNAATNGSQIRFKQERFLMRTGAERDGDLNRLWHIPLTLALGVKDNIGEVNGTGQYTVCWIRAKEGDLSTNNCPPDFMFPPLPPGSSEENTEKNFIVANVQQIGFFRVNYDAVNWKRISSFLSTRLGDRINEVSRGQLIDDAFNLARAGGYDVSYGIVFDLIEYLKEESKYGPFASAMDNLRYLDQMLRGVWAEYQPLVAYMQKLFRGLYPSASNSLWSTQTWAEGRESEYTTLLFDNAVIENACFYEHPQCLTETKERFKAWRTSGTQLSSPYTTANDAAHPVLNFPQTRNMILCYGIREGAESDWNDLNDMHNRETTTGAKSSLLRALACTKNEGLLDRLLEKSVDGTVRDQDKNAIFAYISRWDAGATKAWEFIKKDENWNRLARRSNIIADVTAAFNDPTRLKELEKMNEDRGVGKPEQDAFKKALDRVRANIAWTDASKTEVLAELNKRKSP